jgi:imidazolonepropionase-like amidohydrolase
MLALLLSLAHASSPLEADPLLDLSIEPRGTLLRNARLIDATGAQPRMTDIWVVDGLLHEIGPDLEPSLAAEVLDLDGQSVVPGLIDGHVHVTLAPGQYVDGWTGEELDAHLQHHLRAYVAAGVTTVLDCTALDGERARLQAHIDTGAPSPEVHWLGQPAALPEGYGPAVIPEIPTQSSADEVRAHLDAQAASGVVGTKVLWEDGMLKPVWPLPEGDWLEALVTGAEANELPLFVHAMTPEETLGALEALDPHAIVHGLSVADPEAIAAIAASGAYVVSTMHISASGLLAWYPERIRDTELGQLLTHPDELDNLLDPETRDASTDLILALVMPKGPKGLIKRLMNKSSMVDKVVEQRLEATRSLHEAGVPLVMGSDAPGWPVMLDNIPAWSTIQEMQMLAEAGLEPDEVLIASTRRPAEMIGISESVGTLEVGKTADLVVLSSDPLSSVKAYESPTWVMHRGEIRTPAEWMKVD